jgi:hypothetical protein
MFLEKAGVSQCEVAKVNDLTAWRNAGQSEKGTIPSVRISSGEWNLPVGKNAALFEKLKKIPTKLEDVTSRIFQGIKTSADKIYIVEEIERKNKRVRIYSRAKEAKYWLEPDLLHPLVKGGDSKRYLLSRTNRLVLFPYAKEGDTTRLIPEQTMKQHYPLTWAYLLDNKSYLENREDGKVRGPRWYGFIYPKALDVMPLTKIFTPDIADHSSFSLDDTGKVFFTGGVAGGYGVLVSSGYSREYILGLLNSKLLEWYIRQSASQMQGGYYSFESRFIRNLPIHVINSSDRSGKKKHDRIVKLVERMLELHKELAKAKSDNDKTLLQRQISSTDRQINSLVYDLYDLTANEIKIVEDS